MKYADEFRDPEQAKGILSRIDALVTKIGATAERPVNIMEILAITQVFELRVINQYAVHSRADGVHELVKSTIDRIVEDEKWHIQWIRDALKEMEADYGADNIRDTLKRFTLADREVYQKTAQEHQERIGDLRLAAR